MSEEIKITPNNAEAIYDACTKVFEELAKAIKKAVHRICELWRTIKNKFLAGLTNKRVVYLAYHAKKARTRKKNKHRIEKQIRRFASVFSS